MIILGQLGSGDLMKTYVAQIKEPNQTVWVKLWAFEGIVNAVEEGARIPGDTQVSTARVIADFLTNTEDVPYPVQLRALEALSALKQGCDTNRPERATMANAAMKFLADREAEFEVRSEAARALGLMAIPATVRKYNYPLVAHSIGALVADLGTQINALVPERTLKTAAGKSATAPDARKPSSKASGKPSGKPLDKPSGKASDKTPKGKALAASTSETAKAASPAHTNPLKAQYFTTLLIGPVYQAFEGVPGPRGETGGLVRSSSSEKRGLLPEGIRSGQAGRQGSGRAHDFRLSADQRQEEGFARPRRSASRLPREKRPVRTAPCSGRRGFSSRAGFGQMIEVRPAPWLRHVVSCSLALCSIGCRDVLGPEKMRVVSVDGLVTQGKKKVTRGWIEFVPVDGTVGRMRSARVLEDGTFHATKVAVGINLIRLVNADIDDPDLRRRFWLVRFADPADDHGRARRSTRDRRFRGVPQVGRVQNARARRAAEPRPSR